MSEIRATTISDAAGTGPITLTGQSAAKAWVNFDGTGTIAARDSFNVSSLTDRGTGAYTTNFSSSMANTNFAWNGASSASVDNDGFNRTGVHYSTSNVEHTHHETGGTTRDTDYITTLIHGDLA